MTNLISCYALDRIFEKDKFEIACATNKSFVVHYAIVYGQWLKYQPYIEKNSKSIDVNTPIKIIGLRPIHLGTIMEDEKALNYLLSRPETDWGLTDEKEWNIFHFAIFNPKIKQFLLKNVKLASELLKKPNNEGLTPDQLFERTLVPQQDSVTFFYGKEERDGNAFRKITGAFLLNRPLLTPETIINDWLYRIVNPDFDTSYLGDLKKFLGSKEKPRVYVDEVKEINGKGVFARRKMGPGEIIDIFYGKRDVKKKRLGNDYNLRDNDPTECGKEMMLSNDGFPNMAVSELCYGSFGYQTFISFGVEEDKPLLWDYGCKHPIKVNRYREFNPQGLNRFCEKHSPKEIFANRLQHKSESTCVGDKFLQDGYHQLKYVMNTPSVLMRLLLENRWKAKDFDELVDNEQFSELFEFKNNPGHFFFLQTVIGLGMLFQEMLHKMDDSTLLDSLQTTISNLFSYITSTLGMSSQEDQQKGDPTLQESYQKTVSDLFLKLASTYSVVAAVVAFDLTVQGKEGFSTLVVEGKGHENCLKRAQEVQTLLQWYHDCEKEDDLMENFKRLEKLLKDADSSRVIYFIDTLFSYDKFYMDRFKQKSILSSLLPLIFKEAVLENNQDWKKMSDTVKIIYQMFQSISQYKPQDSEFYVKTMKQSFDDLIKLHGIQSSTLVKLTISITLYIEGNFPEQKELAQLALSIL